MKLNSVKRSLVLFTIVTSLFNSTLDARIDRNILAYKDRGIKYYPRYVPKGLVKIGKASWYGNPFHGRLTANGERYNMYGMTAAHKTYALGTRLKVTNLRNKRSVKVRVNDRGPFHSTRKIDLSYGAAKKLGMIHSGVSRVKIEVLSSPKSARGHKRKIVVKKRLTKTHPIKKAKRQTKKRVLLSKAKHYKSIKRKTAKKSIKHKSKIAKRKVTPQKRLTKKVQLASFSSKKDANNFKRKLHLKNSYVTKHYLKKQKKTTYRVVVKCSKVKAKKLLKSKKFSGAYVVS